VVLGHAQILGRGVTANCIVRDLSETGAKLGVSSRTKLPAEFYLHVVQKNLKVRVRLIWREGDFAGVAFCAKEQIREKRGPLKAATSGSNLPKSSL
jgi:uncharacterized protein YfaT (DUF1175 family)